MSAPKSFTSPLPLDDYQPTDADRERAVIEGSLGMVPVRSGMLSQPSRAMREAELPGDYVRDVIERLYSAAEGQRAKHGKGKKRTLVGLAGPQIGEPVRIILIDTKVQPSRKSLHKLECFINPEIIWRSREAEEGREGCFSTGEVWGLVRRSVAVKIRALTPDGRQTERVFEGFTARIAQHEIDHLSGIRFPERITNDKKRHWVHTEEIEAYIEHIHHWPRLCTRAQWDAYRHHTP
jgi:peptide deformylase